MSAILPVEPRSAPLTLDEYGVWRVTGTRIPLERIIECHKAGATPESIVDTFDSLRLADVYAIISYYLDHKAEVEEYLRVGDEEADETRRIIEARQGPPPWTREELLARRANMEGGGHAAAGQ